MSEMITLWTRQVPQVWEELCDKGYYKVKSEYIQEKNGSISKYYLDLYEWYTKAARSRFSIEEECKYPIWLSVTEDMMLQPTKDTLILKLEIPREKVLLCNNEAWGYRVNYWYIPLDDADEKRYNEELKRNGISNEADLIMTDKGNFYPILKQKIIRSWERVFTLKPDQEDKYVATIWNIKREWVKEVRQYGKDYNVDGPA